MSESCLSVECRTCKWYVNKGGKLGCNWDNRLGLGKPEIARYIEDEVEKVLLENRKENNT